MVKGIDAFLDVPGHMYDEECRLLQKLATGKIVLDIGTHYGRSAVAMAGTALWVDTVDNYQGDAQINPPVMAETLKKIAASGLGDKIEINQADFMEFLEAYGPRLHDYGMIFYDGPHIPPVYEKHFLDFVIEFEYRGVVAIHDYKHWDKDMALVVEAVDDFEKKTGRVRNGPLLKQSIVWFDAIQRDSTCTLGDSS